MNNLENNHIVKLINKILEMPGDEMPKDLTLNWLIIYLIQPWFLQLMKMAILLN